MVIAMRVCPWWIGYFLVCPIRRLAEDPAEILSPYISRGATVLEPGPGMGFFTLEMARMVGPEGRVVAIDVQERMLGRLRRRAQKAKLGSRVEVRRCESTSLGIDDLAGRVDFTLAYAMVHELPDGHPFFSEIALASKPGATLLLAEPQGHVSSQVFEAEIGRARHAGFALEIQPVIRGRHTAVLVRSS